jgi:hypothetical protein
VLAWLTRFCEAFRKANFEDTLAGKIVLSIGCDHQSDGGLVLSDEAKNQLDQLHLEKIRLADEILILNVDGYVGESTRNEVLFAFESGKILRWLEPDKIPADLKHQLNELSI